MKLRNRLIGTAFLACRNALFCKANDAIEFERCIAFNLDCQSCVQAEGCFYCPADGLCVSDPSRLPDVILSGSRCEERQFLDASTCGATDLFQQVSDGSDRDTPFYSDPLYSANAWVFRMINLLPAWEKGYTGAGVRVRVNDGGVEKAHPELAGRFDEGASCASHEPNYTEPFALASHGTNVASIVGASGDDGCSVGIAPGVTFSACHFGQVMGADELFGRNLQKIDIVQSSFGLSNCIPFPEQRRLQVACPFVDDSQYNINTETSFPCDVCDFSLDDLGVECEESIAAHCQMFGFGDDLLVCFDMLELFVAKDNVCFASVEGQVQNQIRRGILLGRGGKGLIYVFSAGNNGYEGDNVNFDGVRSSRFTISVGATAPDGRRSTFSTGGSALTVSAPGGSFRYFNDFVAAGANGTCTPISQGTSFSAPIVSGVIALMLEANPDLTWRDVQGILAKTSRVPNVLGFDGQVTPESAVFGAPSPPEFVTTDAVTNGAGFTHSYGFGFGVIDAAAAVGAAEGWENFDYERLVTKPSEFVNSAVADDETVPTVSRISVQTDDVGEGFVVESVSVQAFFRSPPHGDLRIVLTSPRGTESILAPGNRILFYESTRWTLSTVRSWGEDPLGDWTLTVVDVNPGSEKHLHDQRSFFSRWRLTIYGRGGGVAAFTVPPPPTQSPTSVPSQPPTVAPTAAPQLQESESSSFRTSTALACAAALLGFAIL